MSLFKRHRWRDRTDAELLAAAHSDASPFRELYDRYVRRVLAYQRRRCRDEAAAYELTAETFAQAWLSRERFRDEAGGSAGPWLFAIARNVLLASVRAGTLEQRARDELALHTPLSYEEAATPDPAWLDGIDEALAELPEPQREAVRLRVVEGAGYDEVAAALDTTPAAARVRVHRALGAMRRKLGDNENVNLSTTEEATR
jgi:RNA polymerase sigma-70 factor (ECF subfamily)